MGKLYQLLMEKFGSKEPVVIEEKKIYNPLGARVHSTISLDVLDFRDHYSVVAIREVSATLDGKKQRFADYHLQTKSLDGQEKKAILRLGPTNEAPFYQALVLQQVDAFPYDAEFDTNVFLPENDLFNDREGQEYIRVGGIVMPYSANEKMLEDGDNDGTVEAEEVILKKILFKDYWAKQTKDGVEETHFFFIEKDQGNGYFTLLKGKIVDTQKVDVF